MVAKREPCLRRLVRGGISNVLAFVLLGASAAAPGAAELVINEIDYDQPGSDDAEFIELRNNGASTVNLDSFSIKLIDAAAGPGEYPPSPIDLPDVDLAPGAYFVVSESAATVANTDFVVVFPGADGIQNGSPDAVQLLDGATIVDTVSYEGTTVGFSEGTGTSDTDDDVTPNVGLSRFPDGADTNDNATDVLRKCITPGAANTATATSCPTPVIVTATKVDALKVDNDSDTVADPGDTLRHTVEIEAVSGDAVDVQFQDTVGSNTTFVGGSTQVTPIAFDDTYDVTCNVSISVSAVSGVLGNDVDPDHSMMPLTSAGLTAVNGATMSANGGNVAVAADGGFTYEPPAGFSGTDTFGYTARDEDSLDSVEQGIVTLTVGNDCIWFIDNAVTSGANAGTLADPFQSTASLNAAQGTVPGPQAGDLLLLYTGSGPYTTGIDLLASQRLAGQGVSLTTEIANAGITLAPHSDTIPSVPGTRPLVTSSDDGIDLASGNTVRGLNIDNTSGAAFAGNSVGTATVDTVAISGSGAAVSITTGNLAMTFDSIGSTSSAAPGIDLNGVSGSFSVTDGSGVDTTLSGAANGISVQGSSATFSFAHTDVSSSGDGIDLGGTSANSGATFTFDSLDVTVTSGDGLVASNSGTLNVRGSANTIAVTGGAALDVNNTILGNGSGGAMTFSSLSSTNSAAHGIDLTNLPANSRLTVTGTTTVDNATATGSVFNSGHVNIATVGAGSTITFGATNVIDRQGTGILLSNVAGTVGFGNTTIANPNAAAGYGVRIDGSSAAFTFDSLTVTGTVVGTAGTYDMTRGLPTNDGDGDAVFLKNNTGSVTINGGTLADLGDNAIDIRNSDNTVLDGVTIDDGADANAFSSTNSAIQWYQGSNLTLRNVIIKNIGNDAIAAALVDDHGLRIQDVDGDLVIEDSMFDTATGYVFTNGTAGSPNRAVEIDNRGAFDLDVTVTGSTFKKFDFQGLNLRHVGGSLDAVIGGAAMGDANTFENINGAAVNTGPAQQSATGNVHGLLVEGNTFTSIGIGVEVFSARGNVLNSNRGTHATIRNNTIANTISDAVRLNGFAADGGSPVGGSLAPQMRSKVTGNTITGVGTQAPNLGGGNAFFVAAEDSANHDAEVSGHMNVSGGAGGGNNFQGAVTTQNQRNGDLDLVFQNNSFTNFPGAAQGFGLGFFGNDSSASSASTATAVRFGGNDWGSIAAGFGDTLFFDAFGNAMDVEGYAGGASDSAALHAYISTLDSSLAPHGGFTLFTGPVTGNAVTVVAPTLPPLTP